MALFPIQSALARGQAESDRKFQRYLLDMENRNTQAALDREATIQDTAIEAQKAIQDLQAQAMTLLTDAMSELAKHTDEQNKVMEEANKNAERFQAEAAEALEKIAKALAGGVNSVRPNSAGGRVGARRDKGPYVDGRIAATGEIKLHYVGTNADNVPKGWLICNGAELPIRSYKELYGVIGHSYGIPTQIDTFKLPAKTDLTGDAAITGKAYLQYIVRT